MPGTRRDAKPRDDWSACPDGYKECACGGAKRPARHSPAGCTQFGPGRPSLGDAARSRVVTIKLTEAEHKQWLAMAGGLPLSEWIRQRCSA